VQSAATFRLRRQGLQAVNKPKERRPLLEIGGPEDAEPGQNQEQRDVTISRSLPGVARIVLATLLAEASEPCASEIATRREVCTVSLR
jgi:hypothetical protein